MVLAAVTQHVLKTCYVSQNRNISTRGIYRILRDRLLRASQTSAELRNLPTRIIRVTNLWRRSSGSEWNTGLKFSSRHHAHAICARNCMQRRDNHNILIVRWNSRAINSYRQLHVQQNANCDQFLFVVSVFKHCLEFRMRLTQIQIASLEFDWTTAYRPSVLYYECMCVTSRVRSKPCKKPLHNPLPQIPARTHARTQTSSGFLKNQGVSICTWCSEYQINPHAVCVRTATGAVNYRSSMKRKTIEKQDFCILRIRSWLMAERRLHHAGSLNDKMMDWRSISVSAGVTQVAPCTSGNILTSRTI